MFNPVRMQIRLAQAPEKVYQAITDPRALEQWFSEHAEVTPQQYDFWGKYTPEAPDRAEGKHPLVSQTADRELVYDWRLKHAVSRATIKLLPRDGGTILTVRQIASESAEDKWYHLEDFWFLVLENLRRYLDGKPSEARVDYTNPMQGDIQHSTLVDAPPEKVFDALMRPEQVERWIATKATIEPVVGGKYDIGWGDSSAGVKIVELVPNEKLSITMPEHPEYGKPGRSHTTMTWTLEGSGGKTRLTFTHSGFDSDEDVSGVYVGWRSFLNNLRSVVEYGDAWEPMLVPVAPEAFGYSGAIIARQNELVDELKAE
jgi:uncharacterized protein YndB with AHSA1/START domain